MARLTYFVAALALLNSPVLADIFIDQAMVTNGELRVVGRLGSNHAAPATVTLDGKGEVASDREGRFAFRLARHPVECMVTLKV